MPQDKIKLRAVTKNDAKVSWKWRNSPEIREYYSSHPFFVTEEAEEENLGKQSFAGIPLTVFGIEEIATNNLIGMTMLKDINPINRVCEFAILIGDKNAKGKGYSKEATLKTIDFAFNDLNLNRVFLIVQEDNVPAKKLYERCGFRVEGFLRESVFKNGKYKNEIIMAILKKDYFVTMKTQNVDANQFQFVIS